MFRFQSNLLRIKDCISEPPLRFHYHAQHHLAVPKTTTTSPAFVIIAYRVPTRLHPTIQCPPAFYHLTSSLPTSFRTPAVTSAVTSTMSLKLALLAPPHHHYPISPDHHLPFSNVALVTTTTCPQLASSVTTSLPSHHETHHHLTTSLHQTAFMQLHTTTFPLPASPP